MILNTKTMTKIFQMKMITTGVIFGFLFFHCASGLKIEKPRNLRATVNGSKVLIKWQPSVPTQGDVYYYVVTWKRTNKNETEDYAIADNDNSFVRDFGNATGLYTIGVQAGNNVGIRSEFAYLYNVSIGGNYTITTQSTKLTTAQHSNTTTHTHELLKRTNPTAMSMPLIAGGSTGAFVFLCLAVFIFLFLLRKIQKKRRDRSIQEFESRWFEINLQKTNAAIERPNRSSESGQKKISYVALLKRWQISPNRLKVLNKPLGVGQFGIVKKGLYSPQSGGDPKDVAVKMLKDNATQSALSNLLAELKILKKINKEPHPNVIRFIGGLFTEDQLMVVTEYCSSGNLLKFLRRSKIIDTGSNASYSESDKLISTLSSCQLLKIAVEVSSGMLYLSKKKLVHRDLAARNILLGGEGNVAKISDFGLARDIRNTQAYIRTNQDLLPVKWMALESLTEDRFTTASDVWSFGILLYEIVTLGQEPYKGVSPYDIKVHVVSGGRMEKPPYCSSEIYGIMLDCWKAEANERPNFSEISKNVYGMMNDAQKSHINVERVMGKNSVRIEMAKVANKST